MLIYACTRATLQRENWCRKVATRRLAVLSTCSDADGVTITARAPSRRLLVAGLPLHESIVQHGPFVMNTPEQIAEATADCNSGRTGMRLTGDC
ncbi:MAG: pirin-like C-terminal cupin domain-containing protein [Chromatiales bacterium]